MWLYVAKWYGDSSGKWKNLYYRGDQVDPSACTLQWDSLPRQNPGIWLSDDQNNLRVVVGTKVVMPETTKDCLVKEQGEAEGALDGAFTPVKETQAAAGGSDEDATCAPASLIQPLTSMDLLEPQTFMTSRLVIGSIWSSSSQRSALSSTQMASLSRRPCSWVSTRTTAPNVASSQWDTR